MLTAYKTRRLALIMLAVTAAIWLIAGTGSSSRISDQTSLIRGVLQTGVASSIAKLLRKSTLTSEQRRTLIDYFGFDPSDVKTLAASNLLQIHRSKLVDLGQEYQANRKFAYVQYATDLEHLCPALINFVKLKEYSATADFVLLYTGHDDKDTHGNEARMLEKLEAQNVIVKRVDVIDLPSESSYWSKSFTKFQVFALTEYERVVYFDSDSIVKRNMDELFTLPDSVVALPVNYNAFREFDGKLKIDLDGRLKSPPELTTEEFAFYEENIEPEESYLDEDWLLGEIYANMGTMRPGIDMLAKANLDYELADYIMVVHPLQSFYDVLMTALKSRKKNEYDMDVLNSVLNLRRIQEQRRNFVPIEDGDTVKYIPLVQILAHNPYALLSGEFRTLQRAHDAYLADPQDLPKLAYYYTDVEALDQVPQGCYTIGDVDVAGPDLPYWSWYWNRMEDPYGWWGNSVVLDSKFIHFSDSPLPKPWVQSDEILDKMALDAKEECIVATAGAVKECPDEIAVWTDLYWDYYKLVVDTC